MRNCSSSACLLPGSTEKEGRKLTLEGVPVFDGTDKFLPGKIAVGLTDFLLALPKDDPGRVMKMQEALKHAAEVPLKTAQIAAGALAVARTAAPLAGAAVAQLRQAGGAR